MEKAKKLLNILNEEAGTLIIKVDTDTFENNPGPEIAKVLKRLVLQLESGTDLHYIELKDAKGNIVGSAEFEN